MRFMLVFAGGVAASAAVASASPANYSVNNRPDRGERGLKSILNLTYGGYGGFSPSNVIRGATNFMPGSTRTRTVESFVSADGAITARRVIDRNGTGLFSIGDDQSGADDQNWSDGTVSISAETKYGSDVSSFGFIDNASGSITTVVGDTVAQRGISSQFSVSTSFRWFLRNNTQQVIYTSDEADNNGRDNLITYEITGLGVRTFLLFWEDREFGGYDYNDAVIQLQVVSTPPVMAPLPTAAAMGLAGLGLLGHRRRR